MDPKALRAQREKDLRGLVTLAVLDGDEDKLVTRLLDSLEDIDGAFTFFAQRKRGIILDLEPGQQLGRWDTNVRFNERMDRDPELYAEMVRQPRYLMAAFTQEATGLPIVGFLAQVKEVRFVEEEPGLHLLLLPACHRGCGPVKSESADECIMCGLPRPSASSNSRPLQERYGRYHSGHRRGTAPPVFLTAVTCHDLRPFRGRRSQSCQGGASLEGQAGIQG